MIAGLTVVILLVVIVLIILAQRDTPALAELRIRDREVELERPGTAPRLGVEGEGLRAGDTLRTDVDGQAQIDYFTGAVMRLDVNTTLVIDGLVNASNRRWITLQLNSGRSWNRVEGLTSTEDRFAVQMPNALATVRGTTNVTDCRQDPTCYVLAFVDDTQIIGPGDERIVAGPGDCVRVDEAKMRPCTDHELKRLLNDSWLDEMKTLDGLHVPRRTTPSPSASPTTSPAPGGAIRSRATPTPSPVVRPTRSPRPSRTPDETEDAGDPGTDEPPPPPSPPSPPPPPPPPPPEPAS